MTGGTPQWGPREQKLGPIKTESGWDDSIRKVKAWDVGVYPILLHVHHMILHYKVMYDAYYRHPDTAHIHTLCYLYFSFCSLVRVFEYPT